MHISSALLGLAGFVGVAFAGWAEPVPFPHVRSMDYSSIRGANYLAVAGQPYEHWMHYNPKETDRDLDYARKIGINQIRVFLSFPAYVANKEAFLKNLLHLVRACATRGMGLMPVMFYQEESIAEPVPYPRSSAWVDDVLGAIGEEPGLAVWDAGNEPDFFGNSPMTAKCTALARAMAIRFRERDRRRPRTPVTIGFATWMTMMKNADVVDVLSYHDYSPRLQPIRESIANVKAFSGQVKKPVICTEIGCTDRSNPYDLSIEEYSRARVGFYVWELMITSYWGDIHGIFYADGTVRDPAIAAAMLGIYRNRGADVRLESPDREGLVTQVVTDGRRWLGEKDARFEAGLDVAEMAANLLEANQLVAMRDLPTRQVAFLRQAAPPDFGALRKLLEGFLRELEPYQRKTLEKAPVVPRLHRREWRTS